MSHFTTYQFRKMPVRIVRKNDKNYFVIRDICNILGWSNPNRELAKHTGNVPLYERIRTPGGLQVVRLVPRADVEKLLAANSGHKALLLERWLRTELFPKLNETEKNTAQVRSQIAVLWIFMVESYSADKYQKKLQ